MIYIFFSFTYKRVTAIMNQRWNVYIELFILKTITMTPLFLSSMESF